MMNRWSRGVPLLLLAVALVAGFQNAVPRGQEAPPRDGVFIHIGRGAEDPHAVVMALSMASIMAPDHDVLLYFDLRGINVVLKDAPDLAFGTFEPSKAQLAALIEKKVPIYACPGCLKAAGKMPDDLMEGVKPAEKAAFFNFTKGRILTLDY